MVCSKIQFQVLTRWGDCYQVSVDPSAFPVTDAMGHTFVPHNFPFPHWLLLCALGLEGKWLRANFLGTGQVLLFLDHTKCWSFKIALLKYNLHAIKFTSCKGTCQGFLVNSYSEVGIPASQKAPKTPEAPDGCIWIMLTICLSTVTMNSNAVLKSFVFHCFRPKK